MTQPEEPTEPDEQGDLLLTGEPSLGVPSRDCDEQSPGNSPLLPEPGDVLSKQKPAVPPDSTQAGSIHAAAENVANFEPGTSENNGLSGTSAKGAGHSRPTGEIRLAALLSECLMLIALSVSALFFGAVAFGFFVYSYFSLPFFLAAASSLVSGASVLVSFPERWARISAFAGEPAFAGHLLIWSSSAWQKFVGKNGPGTVGKLSSQAEFYLWQQKFPEAEVIFRQLIDLIPVKGWKFPTRAESAFQAYHRYLARKGQAADADAVLERLKLLRKQTRIAKFVFLLLPLPVVLYLCTSELIVRSIATTLIHGEKDALRTRIKWLADIDSGFFGGAIGAKVYCDYATTLQESCGDDTSALWCARAGLMELKRCPSAGVACKLYTIIASVYVERGDYQHARDALRQAVEISMTNKEVADWQHDGKAFGLLADIEAKDGKLAVAEKLYSRAAQSARPADRQTDEYLSLLDRASCLQSSLGAVSKAADTKKQICDILTGRLSDADPSAMHADQIEDHRRLTRELDACAALLRQSGREDEAKSLASQAALLRTKRVRPLVLGLRQQSEIVDTTTRTTNLLLSVKYKTVGWRKSLGELRNNEFKSKRAIGAIENIPWFVAGEREPAIAPRSIEIEMAAMKVRNFQEPNTLAVDVSGTVRIIDKGGHCSTDDERFAFAYLLKRIENHPPTIECVIEN